VKNIQLILIKKINTKTGTAIIRNSNYINDSQKKKEEKKKKKIFKK